MRENLLPLEGKRAAFTAVFSRRDVFATSRGWRPKVLLKHLNDLRSRFLEDHVSVTDMLSLQQMALLKEGDLIAFSAIVRKYLKGYHGDDIDLRLKHPCSADYALYDVRDVVKLNPDAPKKRIPAESRYNELMKNRHITLGVAG